MHIFENPRQSEALLNALHALEDCQRESNPNREENPWEEYCGGISAEASQKLRLLYLHYKNCITMMRADDGFPVILSLGYFLQVSLCLRRLAIEKVLITQMRTEKDFYMRAELSLRNSIRVTMFDEEFCVLRSISFKSASAMFIEAFEKLQCSMACSISYVSIVAETLSATN